MLTGLSQRRIAENIKPIYRKCKRKRARIKEKPVKER